MRPWTISALGLCLALGVVLSLGCRRETAEAPGPLTPSGPARSGGEVVVYISVDQPFSQPIVEDFHDATRTDIRPVYDTEETKTTGMANRLVAEKDNPQADVFWSNEAGRIMVLKQKGVLTPYVSPTAADVPEGFKDLESYWTGFSARARVIIYNTELVEPVPAMAYRVRCPAVATLRGAGWSTYRLGMSAWQSGLSVPSTKAPTRA